MKYRLILWDFDGTLADTLQSARAIYNELAARHGFRPISDPAAVREMTAWQMLKTHRIPLLKLPWLVREFLAAQKGEIKRVPIFPGLADVLSRMHAAGSHLGVVSSNSEENIRICLKENGVDDCFRFIEGVSLLFGKERALHRAIDSESVEPSSVLYVGDEIRDIEAARKVNVDIAAVTWGFNSERALREHQPTYLVTTPQQLLEAASSRAPGPE